MDRRRHFLRCDSRDFRIKLQKIKNKNLNHPHYTTYYFFLILVASFSLFLFVREIMTFWRRLGVCHRDNFVFIYSLLEGQKEKDKQLQLINFHSLDSGISNGRRVANKMNTES